MLLINTEISIYNTKLTLIKSSQRILNRILDSFRVHTFIGKRSILID